MLGQAGGPALVILAAGRRREMTPHATLLLTEPKTYAEGAAADVAIHEEEHRRKVDAFYIRLAEVTGREVDEIRDDAREGRMLTAEQAREYGLIHGHRGHTAAGRKRAPSRRWGASGVRSERASRRGTRGGQRRAQSPHRPPPGTR